VSVLKLVRRVCRVAAAGNFSDDLAHPTQDIISPDTGPGEVRRIRNDCAEIPAEIPGVIGVSATGAMRLKSSYSNYGSGVIQVAAPGGDIALQATPAAPNGLVLSIRTGTSTLAAPTCERMSPAFAASTGSLSVAVT